MRFLGTLRGSKCVLHAGVIQITGSQRGSCDEQLLGSLVSSFSDVPLCLVSVSIAVNRHHDCGSSYKGKHLTWVVHSFRGSVHHCHGGKHGSMQADMVLEERRVVHLDLQLSEATVCHTGHSLTIRDLKTCLHSDILPPM